MNKHPLKWTIFGMIFFTFIVAFRIFFGLTNYFIQDAPDWFFYISLIFLILEIYSIYAVYNFKKIGLYLFPFSLLIEIFYYALAGFFTIDNIVGLFWYIGFGLLFIIPNWNLFKSNL